MKFLQILTLIWTALIFTFSIIKPPTAGTTDMITLHFAAYAFLAVLALSSTAGKRLKVFAAVVCYGIALEILQNFTGRTFSPIDITANCIGALAATAVFCLVNRQNS